MLKYMPFVHLFVPWFLDVFGPPCRHCPRLISEPLASSVVRGCDCLERWRLGYSEVVFTNNGSLTWTILKKKTIFKKASFKETWIWMDLGECENFAFFGSLAIGFDVFLNGWLLDASWICWPPVLLFHCLVSRPTHQEKYRPVSQKHLGTRADRDLWLCSVRFYCSDVGHSCLKLQVSKFPKNPTCHFRMFQSDPGDYAFHGHGFTMANSDAKSGHCCQAEMQNQSLQTKAYLRRQLLIPEAVLLMWNCFFFSVTNGKAFASCCQVDNIRQLSGRLQLSYTVVSWLCQVTASWIQKVFYRFETKEKHGDRYLGRSRTAQMGWFNFGGDSSRHPLDESSFHKPVCPSKEAKPKNSKAHNSLGQLWKMVRDCAAYVVGLLSWNKTSQVAEVWTQDGGEQPVLDRKGNRP